MIPAKFVLQSAGATVIKPAPLQLLSIRFQFCFFARISSQESPSGSPYPFMTESPMARTVGRIAVTLGTGEPTATAERAVVVAAEFGRV
jgi:hypothetical protein